MYCHIFLASRLILLVTLFCPLHANYSRQRLQTGESFSVPVNVIGIFYSETNSPATAASLAVENFNIDNPGTQTFSYKHLFPNYFENSTDAEISTTLQNSVIVTGDPVICEELSEIVSNLSSYLTCYGPPTPPTLENLESTANLYLSQQNPKAFAPCLFSLIELLHLRHCSTSSSSSSSSDEVGKEQEDSYPLTVSMLLDRTHPSTLAHHTLLRNLSGKKIRVNISWLEEESGCFSPNLNETIGRAGFHVVVAALHEYDLESLLCTLHRRRCSGQNVTLILLSGGVGLPSKHWLKDVDGSNSICEADEVLAAAEGHFLLEFPAWEIASERNTKIVRRQLDQKLLENRERFRFYYDEAPLAYDSVWAMMQAITRANANFPPNGNSHHNHSMKLEFRQVVAEQLAESFAGISGEMSFDWRRMRNGNKAVIMVNRFENGSYIEIGKHFNSNFSFPVSRFWLELKDDWNCTWGTTHSECSPSTSYEDDDDDEGEDDDDEGADDDEGENDDEGEDDDEGEEDDGKEENGKWVVWIPLICLGFVMLALPIAFIFNSTRGWCKRKDFFRVAPSLD